MADDKKRVDKSKARRQDIVNQAMSLKDSDNGIYGFERTLGDMASGAMPAPDEETEPKDQ